MAIGDVECCECTEVHEDKVKLLSLVCLEEFLKGGHLLDVTGLKTDQLALVHTVGEDKLERTAHIEECRIMDRPEGAEEVHDEVEKISLFDEGGRS